MVWTFERFSVISVLWIPRILIKLLLWTLSHVNHAIWSKLIYLSRHNPLTFINQIALRTSTVLISARLLVPSQTTKIFWDDLQNESVAAITKYLIIPWFRHLAHFGIRDICWLCWLFDFFNMTFMLYLRFILCQHRKDFTDNWASCFATHDSPLSYPPQLPHQWFNSGGRLTVKYFPFGYFQPHDTGSLYHPQIENLEKHKKPSARQMFQVWAIGTIFFASWVELSMKHFIFYFHRCCMLILRYKFYIGRSFMRAGKFSAARLRQVFHRNVLPIGSQLHARLPMTVLVGKNINYWLAIPTELK